MPERQIVPSLRRGRPSRLPAILPISAGRLAFFSSSRSLSVMPSDLANADRRFDGAQPAQFAGGRGSPPVTVIPGHGRPWPVPNAGGADLESVLLSPLISSRKTGRLRSGQCPILGAERERSRVTCAQLGQLTDGGLDQQILPTQVRYSNVCARSGRRGRRFKSGHPDQ